MPDRLHELQLVRQEKFLKAFARVGIIKDACRAAGVDRSTIWRWREGDPAFADAYLLAAQEAVDVLERAAWRRAVDGVKQPDGTVRHSDHLLTFLLKARDPVRFGELQRVQVKSQVDVDARLTVAPEEPGTEHLTAEEIERLSRVVLGDAGGLAGLGAPPAGGGWPGADPGGSDRGAAGGAGPDAGR